MTQSNAVRSTSGLLPDARPGTVFVFAIACGVMVANVYLCQPLLDEMAQSLGVSERLAGFVAVATQIGYALGILFVVPLGDVAAPQRLIRILVAVTAAGLLAAAIAPGIPVLLLASGVIAAATVVAQILIPLAASMAPLERRGRVIGALQTGLILGILFSRTVAGLVASWAGTWRAPYLAAAFATGSLLLILPRFMPPHSPVRDRQSYGALLRSLPPLLQHRALLISSGLGFCIFGTFSAFWGTLAFHLASPSFGLGVAATGLFGLWGAPGALLAPMGGRLSDRIGPQLGQSRRRTLCRAIPHRGQHGRRRVGAGAGACGELAGFRRAIKPGGEPGPHLRAGPGDPFPAQHRVHGCGLCGWRIWLHDGRLRLEHRRLDRCLRRLRRVGQHRVTHPCRGGALRPA